MAKSARVDNVKHYDQQSMDRITVYHNMKQMGFTPVKKSARKLDV